MVYKIQWLGRYPIHALGKNGEQITLQKGEIKELSELPKTDKGNMKILRDASHDIKPKKREKKRGKE